MNYSTLIFQFSKSKIIKSLIIYNKYYKNNKIFNYVSLEKTILCEYMTLEIRYRLHHCSCYFKQQKRINDSHA